MSSTVMGEWLSNVHQTHSFHTQFHVHHLHWIQSMWVLHTHMNCSLNVHDVQLVTFCIHTFYAKPLWIQSVQACQSWLTNTMGSGGRIWFPTTPMSKNKLLSFGFLFFIHFSHYNLFPYKMQSTLPIVPLSYTRGTKGWVLCTSYG